MAIPLLVQLTLIVLLLIGQQQTAEAQKRSHETREVITQFYRVLATLIDTQNALRGFVITADPALDSAFQQASARAPGEISRLRALVGDDAQDLARVRTVDIEASALLGWLAGTAEHMRKGEPQLAVERVAKRSVEPVHRAIQAFVAEAESEEAARRAQLDSAQRRIFWLLGVGTVAALLTALALAAAFSRDIARRLAAISDNARRLGAGEALRPPMGGDDEIARVDRAFRDMSEALGAASERQRQSNEMLARNAKELAVANRELRHRNEENELFVYSVSHDLRTPLVNLQGFSKELRRAGEGLRAIAQRPDVPAGAREEMRKLLDEDVADAVHFISTAVSRLGNITDALLRLSRVGRVEYRPASVDVRAVVERVATSFQATIGETGAQLRIGPLPQCWADPGAVEQVFANLLDNALKYLEPSRRGQIEIGSQASGAAAGPSVTYYVRDNGSGIAEADQSKIFLPFQRAHQGSVAGEGIGLVIVRRIVDRSGGRVWLESRAGEGSTFFVSFPAVYAAAPPPQPRNVPAPINAEA